MFDNQKDIYPMGINVDNPYEYYGTNNIEDLPEHLREQAKLYEPKMENDVEASTLWLIIFVILLILISWGLLA